MKRDGCRGGTLGLRSPAASATFSPVSSHEFNVMRIVLHLLELMDSSLVAGHVAAPS